MNANLVMFKTDGTRRDFPMAKDRIILGRTNSCDLRIPLSSVSRQHCELRIDSGKLKLKDLGSSNGTFHNSIRVQEAVLAPGDEIVVGPVVFTVQIDGQPADITPVRSMFGDKDATGEMVMPLVENTAAPIPAAPPPAQKAQSLDDDDEELELPIVEPETQSPTVDLDDPIAALEALAQNDNDDSGDLPLLAEDDEEDSRKQSRQR